MPRIPTVESLGARPTSLGRDTVVPLRLQTSRAGMIEAEAIGQLGAGVADLGESLARLNERDRVLMNEARTEDATTQYLSELDRLTYDSQVGYQNKLGRNALEDNFRKDYDDLRFTAAKAIEEKLTSPEQINAFRKRAALANRQFDSGLSQHIAKQTNAFHEEVYEGVLTTERSRAAANYREPGQVESSILRSFHVIDIEATRKGMPALAVQAMQQAAETQIHTDVVQTMLMEGNDQQALQYFEGVKARLAPEARIALGMRVQAASTDNTAMRAAQSIWEASGPKGENDPVLIANMENEIRKQYRDDPRTVDSAISQLRSMAQAHNAQQQEITFSRKATVLDAFHNGASLEALQRMPEYLDMDGASRNELRDYMINRGWTEQQRARSDAQYVEGQKAEAGFSTYWELSNPAVLAGMSEAEILSMEPRLGRELVGSLMEQKRRAAAGRGVLSATIDEDMFKVAADEAGLKPYAKNLSEQDKAYLGRLKNYVETLIDERQQSSGRQLTREEKAQIMREEIDKKVLHEKGFFSERELPIGALNREDRMNIRVPIADVDANWMSQAMNYMRSKGYASFKMDDDKLKRLHRARLENAYAIRMAGGTEEEIDRALRGD